MAAAAISVGLAAPAMKDKIIGDVDLQFQLGKVTSERMRITSPEDLALSLQLQGCSVAPHIQDGPSKPKKKNPAVAMGATTIHVVSRNDSPPTPPRPNNPLKLFHRRTSSSSSALSRKLSRTSSFYAGPLPRGADGCPLKSCLKKPRPPQDGRDGAPCCSLGHRVSFSHVQLREYCREAGDNPSVTSGCPLAIGWKYNRRGKCDIDTYEADRDRDPTPCERITSRQRERLLNEVGGVSHTHIMQGQVNAYFARQQRAETLEKIGGLQNYKSVGPRERLFIMRESAVRKLDRAKKGVTDAKEQRRLWDEAHEHARRRSATSADLEIISEAAANVPPRMPPLRRNSSEP